MAQIGGTAPATAPSRRKMRAGFPVALLTKAPKSTEKRGEAFLLYRDRIPLEAKGFSLHLQ